MTDALVVLEDERHAEGERPGRSGWLRRLLVTADSGRRGSWTLGLGVLGAVAFLVSLLLDWQTVTLAQGANDEFVPSPVGTTVGSGVGDMSAFGLVYLFGLIALLAVAGAALNRADVAARLRLGALGGATGIAAVLVAVTARMDDQALGVPMAMQLIYGGGLAIDSDRYTVSLAPGLFAAFAAVLLTTAAIWLAARGDAVRPGAVRFVRRREPSEPTAPEATVAAPDVVGPAALPEYQRPQHAGPLDLTVTPG